MIGKVLVLAAGSTILLVNGLTATPAEAAGGPPHSSIALRLVNQATGQCLGGDSKGVIYTQACNGQDVQLWQLDYLGGTRYTITNIGTGLALASDQPGNVTGTKGVAGDAYQTWSVGDDVYTNAGNSRALDSTTAGLVYSRPANGQPSQRWHPS